MQFARGFASGFMDSFPKALAVGLVVAAVVVAAPFVAAALPAVAAAAAVIAPVAEAAVAGYAAYQTAKMVADTAHACIAGSAGDCGQAVGEVVGSSAGGAAAGGVVKVAGAGLKGLNAKTGGAPVAQCVGSCPCFVAGTAVDTTRGKEAIEEVALGERVGPASAECAALDVEGWATFGLRMVVLGPAGRDVLELEVLRPREWIGETAAQVGSWVDVELEELSVRGPAEVTSIGRAPVLGAGERCPVTGRVRHVSHEVITVALEGGERLEVTQRHPLLSADRGDWVAAGEVRVGERLRSLQGLARVVGVRREARGGEEVFNLEVYGQHRYFVGGAGVVAHNMCAQTAGAAPPGRSGAFHEAKRDLGIPRGQQPDAVRRVRMTNSDGVSVLGKNNKPVMTREYTFSRADGSKVVIQDHGAGHKFGEGGKGDQGAHFNVRPPDNTRTGSVSGTKEHYGFEK